MAAFYHDCNDGLIPCQRRWKFELPNHYITSGKHPGKTLDIGTWNLEAKMPGETPFFLCEWRATRKVI
uniref:ML domain-containing protein n=1 Tax=Globodera pallida TaxID=36090 RepID=A0A183CKN5_GLOPA